MTPIVTNTFHNAGLSEADAVYVELLQTKDPTPKQHDTVERRLKIVLQDLKSLREGLDVKKHPHILSHKRLLFKQRSGHPGKYIRADCN